MSNNASQNSFFSLVVNGDQSAQQGAEAGSAEEAMSTAEGAKAQFSNNMTEPALDTAAGGESGGVDPAATHSPSAMPHEARRVLVHLMRQGALMATAKPKLFELLVRHQDSIRRHLAEVYLRLVLDQKMGVAFVASASYQGQPTQDGGDVDAALGVSEDGEGEDDLALDESTTLIPTRTLSLYDTLLLLVLRKHYQDRESAGEQKITVDIERLESYLTPFLPITDHGSKDRKKLLARVKEMVKRKVLATIRGAEDRYEITPIIRYVVSASMLQSMVTEYALLAQRAGEMAATASSAAHHNSMGTANDQ